MSPILLVLSLLLSLAMILVAFMAISGALSGKNIGISILSAGAVSLFASLMFLLLAAPDVAMTEAAIGSGLTTFLFFFVLGRVRGGEHD